MTIPRDRARLAAPPWVEPVPRPVWWREALVVVLTYGGYTLTRNTMPAHEARARENAVQLYRLEQTLHLDGERAVNDAVAGSATNAVSTVANYTYALSHVGVTLSVLLWLYVARPREYRPARTVLLLTTVLGLVGYWWFPLAPPRFFPGLGFVDTVVRDRMWGSWGSASVTELSNQYAAMPSMHVAWSIWCAAVVALTVRGRWVRVAVWCYPVLILGVVVGTANHWVLDAVGGVAVLGAGTALTVVGARVLAPRQPPTPMRPAAPPSR